MAYTLIATSTLTSISQFITFSSIPGSYKDLEIRGTGKGNANIGAQQSSFTIYLRINNLTGAYHNNAGFANYNASYSNFTSFNDSNLTLSQGLVGSYENGLNSQYRLYFPGYSATDTRKNGSIDIATGFNNNGYVFNRHTGWYVENSINAITTIDLFLSGANQYWNTGTTFSLYGIG